MTIGERIKKRRLELGLSQEQLAHKLGYKSRSSINKIELGGQNLTQTKIKKIADALDTTPAYIMGWDSSNKFKEEPLVTQINIFEGVDRLNETRRSSLAEYINFLLMQQDKEDERGALNILSKTHNNA